MKRQSSSEDEAKTAEPPLIYSLKNNWSLKSQKPALSTMSSIDLDLPTTPKFLDPTQIGFGSNSGVLMENPNGRIADIISSGETRKSMDPLDSWLSKTMKEVEIVLGVTQLMDDDHYYKTEIRTNIEIENKMQANETKKDSEVNREWLRKISVFKSKIHEMDIEIEKEENSLAKLGGGSHLRKHVAMLKTQLERMHENPEILKIKEKNRELTRMRDEQIALSVDLFKENKELREKIGVRNEKLAKLSSIIQNYASGATLK